MANWLSPKIGDGDIKHYNRMHKVLSTNYRGFEDVDIQIDRFMNALAKDKKNIGKGEVTLILPNRDAKIEKGRYTNNELLKSLCNKYLTEVRFK
jgi:3-dehydroquinate synthase